MVLKLASVAITTILPSKFYVHVALAIVAVFTVRALAQGRKTTRDRDLHARVIVVTGAFTPLGLTLVYDLARRGAHVIALTSDAVMDERVATLVDLLRTTTANEHIYAEKCNMMRPSSVRAFCNKFVTGNDTRVDSIIFAHEYAHIGATLGRAKARKVESEAREAGAMATFLMVTLLLPALLVAPVERDIRIIQVVNPFYAAGTPTFTTPLPPSRTSTFVLEGKRALRSAVLAAHLQRVLDALPNRTQPPTAAAGEQTVPVVSAQRSNIVSVSVSPGFSRGDTVRRLLSADRGAPGFSPIGFILYILLQPLLHIFTKSPQSAAQSVLHALFLPTPFKATVSAPAGEVLKPGALYAECAVVNVPLPELPPEAPPQADKKKKEKEKAGEQEGQMPDNGEMGGVRLGQSVWEEYEVGLKEWESSDPTPSSPSLGPTPTAPLPDGVSHPPSGGSPADQPHSQ